MKKLILLSERWNGENGKKQQKHLALCTEDKLVYFLQAREELKRKNPTMIKPGQEYVKTEIPVNEWLDVGKPPIDLSSINITDEE